MNLEIKEEVEPVKKFLQFCQKPLLIIAAIVFGVFTLGLIVTSVIPYANTPYTLTEKVGDDTAAISIVMSGDKLTFTEYYNGEKVGSQEYFFEVKKGELYAGPTKESVSAVGIKVSAYELSDGASVYANGFTRTMRVIDIVMMVLGGLGLAASITLIVLNKKGKLKKA